MIIQKYFVFIVHKNKQLRALYSVKLLRLRSAKCFWYCGSNSRTDLLAVSQMAHVVYVVSLGVYWEIVCMISIKNYHALSPSSQQIRSSDSSRSSSSPTGRFSSKFTKIECCTVLKYSGYIKVNQMLWHGGSSSRDNVLAASQDIGTCRFKLCQWCKLRNGL